MIDKQEQMFHCSRALLYLTTLLLFRSSEAQSCAGATQSCDVCSSLCNGIRNQINVFQNSSVQPLTCPPPVGGGGFTAVMWYHRTSSGLQGTLIDKSNSRYGGGRPETLIINNVVPGDEGLYRCEYTLTGGTRGQDDVGCVFVKGRAAFTSCNSQTCSEDITVYTGQNVTFDTRIMFGNSGACGIPQDTNSVRLFSGTQTPQPNDLLYVCSNTNSPCPETYMYMTSTIHAVNSGGHKFSLNLTLPNAASENGGTYTAEVEVRRPTGGLTTLRKTFHVTVNSPPPTTPPPTTIPSDALVRTILMRVPEDVALNDTDECNTTNGGCEQVCTNILGSFFCSCNSGYRLQRDGSNCSDIDECATSNAVCEHNCTNTIGSFTCSCDTGYQLDRNGLNCTDIDECENDDLNDCHEDASCTNTKGSYSCSCNDGYSGSGTECTDINECEMGNNSCHENANCTNTVGSFTCYCKSGYTGDGTECSMVLTVGLSSTGVLVFIAVVLMIIAIVCGSICVVRKLGKMDAERTKIKLCFSDDVVDLNYSPVSPFSTSKLKTVASVASVFDMLGIPDRQSQASNADSDSTLDTASTLDTDSTLDTESTLDTDGISDIINTLLHHNSITTTVTPNVHMSIFVETGTDASSSPSSITKHFDFNENASCKAEVNSNGNDHLDLHPTAFSEDAHAASCTSTSKDRVHSAIEMQSSSGYVSDTVTSAGQNDEYVRGKYQLQGSHGSLDLSSQVVELEPEFLSSMYLKEAVDPQSHSVNDMVEASKDEALATKELQFFLEHVSDTHHLASVVENPNVLGLQSLEDSSDHGVVEEDVSISKMSPQLFSEDYSTTSDCTFGYFDDTTHSHLNVSRVQHLSANRGYVTDCSKPEEDAPHTMQQMN